MDVLATELLGTVDEAEEALKEILDPDDNTPTPTPNNEMAAQSESGSSSGATADSAKAAQSIRRGIFKAASLQDKLLEKLVSPFSRILYPPPLTIPPKPIDSSPKCSPPMIPPTLAQPLSRP